jgi:hypothetical protein
MSISRGEEVMRKAIILCTLLLVGTAFVLAQTATPRVTKRQVKQHTRIERGVKSGELTPGETKALERQQGKVAADKAKAKSDGVVTSKERARLTHEQNRASKTIYRLKHNTKTAK